MCQNICGFSFISSSYNSSIFEIFCHGLVVHSADISSDKSEVSIGTIRIGFLRVRVQVDRRSNCQANVAKQNNTQK